TSAGKDAPRSFRQGKIGAYVGNPYMGGACQFQPAAHHRTLKASDDRNTTVLDLIEGTVPAMADAHKLHGATLLVVVFLQIRPGTKMVAFRCHDDAPD